MVLLTMSLSAICSSMSILVYDTGTYDAGIVASVHAVATADRPDGRDVAGRPVGR